MKSLPAPHFIVALCLAGSLAGCAHVPGGSAQSEFAGKEEAPTSIQEILDTGPVTGGRESSDGLVVNGIRLQNSRFDYPVVINSRVLFCVDYFTGRGREHFAKYLSRSDYFIPFIRPILRQHGLP